MKKEIVFKKTPKDWHKMSDENKLLHCDVIIKIEEKDRNGKKNSV